MLTTSPQPPARDVSVDSGTYVTDGRRLFRVVYGLAPHGPFRTAVLEDCLTLDIASYTASQLYSMRLRGVAASA